MRGRGQKKAKKSKTQKIIPSPESWAKFEDPWDEEIPSDRWSDSAATEIIGEKGVRLLKGQISESERVRVHYSVPDLIANVGEFIEVDFSPDTADERIMRGKIVEMYSNRPVPDIDDIIVGTPQDPAVKVEIYTKKGNKWKSTGNFAGFKMSELQRASKVSRQANEVIEEADFSEEEKFERTLSELDMED